MEVSPDDLKLPGAVIARLIKDSLPEGVNVSKEAKTAIGRAAAIFILHATTFASENARLKNRKNVSAEDVLTALKSLECEELGRPVRDALELFRQQKEQKNQQRKAKSSDHDSSKPRNVENELSKTTDDVEEE